MLDIKEIEASIVQAEKILSELNEKREKIEKEIIALKKKRELLQNNNQLTITPTTYKHKVTNNSSEKEKISLFLSLFRGREDVFARRFESTRTGKRGY